MNETCFLCGRNMVEVPGKLYKVCSNKDCVRSKELSEAAEQNPSSEVDHDGDTNQSSI